MGWSTAARGHIKRSIAAVQCTSSDAFVRYMIVVIDRDKTARHTQSNAPLYPVAARSSVVALAGGAVDPALLLFQAWNYSVCRLMRTA